MTCDWVKPILSALSLYLPECVLRRVKEELRLCRKVTWFSDPKKDVHFGIFFHFHYPYRLMVYYDRGIISLFLELEYGFFKQFHGSILANKPGYEELFAVLNDLCLEAKGCYLTDIVYLAEEMENGCP